MFETELQISACGFPPFSARGCRQTLEAVPLADIRRSVNGKIVFVGNEAHQNYRTTITCQDTATPAVHGLHRGAQVKISCIQRLVQLLPENTIEIELSRTPVTASVRVFNGLGTFVDHSLQQRTLIVKQPVDKNCFVSFCPELDMTILQVRCTTHEWRQEVEWIITASE